MHAYTHTGGIRRYFFNGGAIKRLREARKIFRIALKWLQRGKFFELHPNAFKPHPFCVSLADAYLQNFIAKWSELISAYHPPCFLSQCILFWCVCMAIPGTSGSEWVKGRGREGEWECVRVCMWLITTKYSMQVWDTGRPPGCQIRVFCDTCFYYFIYL